MSQLRVLPQHLCQPPRSLCTNPVVTKVKISQRLALPQHPRQPPRSLCTNAVAGQGKMSQRLALAQRARQPARSLIANVTAAYVKTSQPLAFPQHPQPLERGGPIPSELHHEMFGKAPEVLQSSPFARCCAGSVHKINAAAVNHQIPSKLRANPQSHNESLSWPHNSQHRNRQQQQAARCHGLPGRWHSTMRASLLPRRGA
eukprot:396792-Rhodomonas_salina.2